MMSDCDLCGESTGALSYLPPVLVGTWKVYDLRMCPDCFNRGAPRQHEDEFVAMVLGAALRRVLGRGLIPDEIRVAAVRRLLP